MRTSSVRTLAALVVVAAAGLVAARSAGSAASATASAARINTTGMGDWTRPTIEGLVERTDYTERHVLYGVYNGTAWTELSFEQRHGTYAVAEVLRNPSAAHRWELIKITSLNDTDAFYTVGYAEALATHVRMYDHWFNIARSIDALWNNKTVVGSNESVGAFMMRQVTYMRSYPTTTPYGRMVREMIRQVDGLYAGWEAAYKASGSPSHMGNYTWRSVYIVATRDMYRDLAGEDLTVNSSSARPKPTHCHALVKLTRDDIHFAHSTLYQYVFMLRQHKTYVFGGGRNVSMSSYPGDVSSTDEFIINGRGVMYLSTELINFNATNAQSVRAHTVPGQLSAMIASYLSATPQEWTDIFRTDDGGSLPNQMMTIDTRAARASLAMGADLTPGTFILCENFPGIVECHDMTAHLQRESYFVSFDVTYFNATRAISGANLEAVTQNLSGLFSWPSTMSPALVRDQALINDTTTTFYAMRHNNWPHDPFLGNPQCKGQSPYPILDCGSAPENVTSPTLGFAARYDLIPADSATVAAFFPTSYGSIDAKVTSVRMLAEQGGAFIMQNGPTFVQQEPFSFEKFFSMYPAQRQPIRGLADTWNVPPALLVANATFSASGGGGGPGSGIVAGVVVAVIVTTVLAAVAVSGLVIVQQRKHERRASQPAAEAAGESTKLI